mmetsp:Transcript_34619/g.75668  ORF Transcript_34619/g.75668 Transcript_34619/m.75668 type:complete len:472 (+) Transcript_34619:279-1694(+)
MTPSSSSPAARRRRRRLWLPRRVHVLVRVDALLDAQPHALRLRLSLLLQPPLLLLAGQLLQPLLLAAAVVGADLLAAVLVLRDDAPPPRVRHRRRRRLRPIQQREQLAHRSERIRLGCAVHVHVEDGRGPEALPEERVEFAGELVLHLLRLLPDVRDHRAAPAQPALGALLHNFEVLPGLVEIEGLLRRLQVFAQVLPSSPTPVPEPFPHLRPVRGVRPLVVLALRPLALEALLAFGQLRRGVRAVGGGGHYVHRNLHSELREEAAARSRCHRPLGAEELHVGVAHGVLHGPGGDGVELLELARVGGDDARERARVAGAPLLRDGQLPLGAVRVRRQPLHPQHLDVGLGEVLAGEGLQLEGGVLLALVVEGLRGELADGRQPRLLRHHRQPLRVDLPEHREPLPRRAPPRPRLDRGGGDVPLLRVVAPARRRLPLAQQLRSDLQLLFRQLFARHCVGARDGRPLFGAHLCN